MVEIFRMWRMCRILKKDMCDFSIPDDEKTSKPGELSPIFKMLKEVLERTKEPRIKKQILALKYSVATQYEGKNVSMQDIKIIKSINQAQSIIDCCVDHGYIGIDDSNNDLVYLKGKGYIFCSSVLGLINKVLEEYGYTTSFMFGVFGTAITLISFKWRIVWEFVIGLFS